MELFEAIQNRHSYRGPFLDQPVPREDLRRIVHAGLMAPSGCNAQTTNFVIVDDAAMVKTINQLPGANMAMQQAKAYITCIIDVKPKAVYESFDFQLEDCAAAVENMMLAITALGYATVWVDGWLLQQNRAQVIGEMLDVPESKRILVILPIGRPAETPSAREKMPFESRAWFNQFGSSKWVLPQYDNLN